MLFPKTEASIAPRSFSPSMQVYKRILPNCQENSTKVHGDSDGLASHPGGVAQYCYIVSSNVTESGTNHQPR